MTTKWTTYQGKTIVLANGSGIPANMEAVVLYNRAYVVSDDSGLDKANYVDVAQVAKKLWSVKAELDSRFSGIENQTAMAILALAMNEHGFFLSAPGTGKTSLVKGLGQAMAGTYWSVQINDEKTTDDIIGVVDAQAYQKTGKMKRIAAGLATADVALLDEIWKGPQVSNVTLEPLEERKIAIGDDEITMPLMTCLAASNEMPPAAYNAALDRFLLRQVVDYITPDDEANFRGMFTAPGLRKPMPVVAEPDEIRLLAATIDAMSMAVPESIIDGCLELAQILGNKGLEFGPRRWIRTAKAAIAWAMLHDETPDLTHLSVGRWTLWNDPEEAQMVEETILGATDPYAGAIITLKGEFQNVVKQLTALEFSDFAAKSELIQQLYSLSGAINDLQGEAKAAKYIQSLNDLDAQIQESIRAAMVPTKAK